MLKLLPALEKDFSLTEVANATPNWLKAIMVGFVLFIIFTAVCFGGLEPSIITL